MAALFEIANDDFTIQAIPMSTGIPTVDAFPAPTKDVSTKVILGGKGALLKSISWKPTSSSCKMIGATFVPESANVTIDAKTEKCMSEEKRFLLKLDTGDCTGKFILNASPFSEIICSCKIIIIKPGQDKVKGS
jgi:hypothetical protein